WDSTILFHNIRKMNLNIRDIDILFLSHQHWDHTGCVAEILDLCSPDVFVPKSFSEHLKSEISQRTTLYEVENSAKISDGVYTTGELGSWIKEQSLLIETDNGINIITGCAHPGVDKIVEKAREFGRIHSIIGGLHDFDRFEILKNIDKIMPCHCTAYKDRISKLFPSKYREIMAGDVIEDI
ncbi:MAG TPA: MBL fold metallo-hydrolase, partial [Candidatus Altiarchaeales archaeon]|nr:MBL fold metallo-hydrolase [Candidatus Altiarchaeales archaeon]HEX55074.1 MBL fold metallo-hydrolase [Candidatus Altiarchaeales archaeon]